MKYFLATFLRRFSLVTLFFVSCFAQAASSSPEAVIQQRLQNYLGVDVQKSAIVKTPYLGLYEVRLGNNLVYTDKQAKYLFLGEIMNLETRENYTEEKLKKMVTRFADLPKDLAIKIVKGNGKREIAVFSDPNCGYCKRFENNLKQVDDVTIYLYPYNILSANSVEISKNAWCSANPAKAWEDWMLNGNAPEKAKSDCNFPNEKIRELGQKLKVSGTPTIFFTDNTRVAGAIDAESLEKKLKSLK